MGTMGDVGGKFFAERLPGQLWSIPQIDVDAGLGLRLNHNGEAVMITYSNYQNVGQCTGTATINYKRRDASGIWGPTGIIPGGEGGYSIESLTLTDSGEIIALMTKVTAVSYNPRTGCTPYKSISYISRQLNNASVWQNTFAVIHKDLYKIYDTLLVDSLGHAGLFTDIPPYGFAAIVQAGAGKAWSQPTALPTSRFYALNTDVTGNVTFLWYARNLNSGNILSSITGNLATNTWSASTPITSKPNVNIAGKFDFSANNNAITAGVSNERKVDPITHQNSYTNSIDVAIRDSTNNKWSLPSRVFTAFGTNVVLLDVKISTNGNAAIVYVEVTFDATTNHYNRVLKTVYYY